MSLSSLVFDAFLVGSAITLAVVVLLSEWRSGSDATLTHEDPRDE